MRFNLFYTSAIKSLLWTRARSKFLKWKIGIDGLLFEVLNFFRARSVAAVAVGVDLLGRVSMKIENHREA